MDIEFHIAPRFTSRNLYVLTGLFLIAESGRARCEKMKKEATNITCPKCRKDTAIVSEVNDGKTHIVEVECECGYWDNEVIE